MQLKRSRKTENGNSVVNSAIVEEKRMQPLQLLRCLLYRPFFKMFSYLKDATNPKFNID